MSAIESAKTCCLAAGSMAADAGKVLASGAVCGGKVLAIGVRDYGIKVPAKIALHLSAEAADLTSKCVAVTGVFASALLLGDVIGNSRGHSLFENSNGEAITILEKFKPSDWNTFWEPESTGILVGMCPKFGSDPVARKNNLGREAIAAFGLCVSTIVVSLACRKIYQIANHYRQQLQQA
ncbi:MAG: hypothetical protein KDK40_04505 [Chlamydiia bacterium]|nr:hypothetical protein [Chlamydiia bacterium]